MTPYQTDNRKLKNKILSESLDKAKAVKIRLAMEQSVRRVEAMVKNGDKNSKREEAVSAVNQQDEEIRKLKKQVAARNSRSGSRQNWNKYGCRFCLRDTHCEGRCPAKEWECYLCGQMGHMKGS